MDAMIDGGSGSAATLTSFVIDLIDNHSTDPTPAPFSAFSALPDPDGGNAFGVGENVPAAYPASLFM